MPAMLLSSYVVPHLHGQMVCQPTGSAAPRDLAVEPRALSNLPSQVLHFRCLHNKMNNSWICFNFFNMNVFHSGFGQKAFSILAFSYTSHSTGVQTQSFLLQPLKWMLIFSCSFPFLPVSLFFLFIRCQFLEQQYFVYVVDGITLSHPCVQQYSLLNIGISDSFTKG